MKIQVAGKHMKTKGSVPLVMPEQNRSRKLAKISHREGKLEARESVLDFCNVSALIVDLKWDECHEASYLLSNLHLL